MGGVNDVVVDDRVAGGVVVEQVEPHAGIRGNVVAADLKIVLHLFQPHAGPLSLHAVVLNVTARLGRFGAAQIGNVNASRVGNGRCEQVIADLHIVVEVADLQSPIGESSDSLVSGRDRSGDIDHENTVAGGGNIVASAVLQAA